MEKFKYLWLILVAPILLSCSNSQKVIPEYNEYVYQPQYAKGFDIKWVEDSSNHIIEITNPWQGATNDTTVFLVANDGFDHSELPIQWIPSKAERIVPMSSTHIAMLDAIGALDKVVAVSGMSYISNPYIRSHENSIPDIGYEGNIDYETLLSVKPDLVLLYAVNGKSSMETRLNELGIPYLYVGDYLEESPLGKAEWIVALAEITGQREKGIEKFNEIEQRYNSLKNSVKEDKINLPKVMVNTPFADAWYMPSTQSYIAQLIKDAGGNYIYKIDSGNASLPIDQEEALKLVSEADIWINTGTANSIEDLQNSFPKFANAKCVISGNIYNNNLLATPGGGNDFYESGIVNPDLILRDLIKAFHPQIVNEDFVYYHHLQ